MAKEHKYHHSRIEIDTSLPVERALNLATQTVETQRGVRLVDAGGEAVSAAITNLLGGRLVHFTVKARQSGGMTRISTELVQYRTSQQTVFFIPVGPKSIEGYSVYRGYMRALQQVVQAADPSARCTITEREAA